MRQCSRKLTSASTASTGSEDHDCRAADVGKAAHAITNHQGCRGDGICEVVVGQRIVCQGRHGKIHVNLRLRQRLSCHWHGLNRTCGRRGRRSCRRSCRCGRCSWLRCGCRCSLLDLGLWSLHRSLCGLGLRWSRSRNWRSWSRCGSRCRGFRGRHGVDRRRRGRGRLRCGCLGFRLLLWRFRHGRAHRLLDLLQNSSFGLQLLRNEGCRVLRPLTQNRLHCFRQALLQLVLLEVLPGLHYLRLLRRRLLGRLGLGLGCLVRRRRKACRATQAEAIFHLLVRDPLVLHLDRHLVSALETFAIKAYG
mmetsp:Transcript_21928/g.51429  ORF Transcript_21928/g.51429 Transcript_21928/m.51429 type:complete len:306 (+) Transcript_21928:207-1124(+)